MSCDSSFRPGLLLCTPSGVLRDGRAGTDVAMATARRLAVLDLRDAEASCPKDLQLIRTEVERILAVHHDNIRFFPPVGISGLRLWEKVPLKIGSCKLLTQDQPHFTTFEPQTTGFVF